LTGLLGRLGQFFFLNQNDVILVKKKIQQVTTRFLTGSTGLPGQPGHTGFFLPLFFLQSGPVPAPDRPVGPGRVSKLWFWMLNSIFIFFKINFLIYF
jgi:hypothetical protein